MREIKFRAWLKRDGILVEKPVMVYQIERCFHDAGTTLDGARCEVRDFHGFSEVLQGVDDGDIILMQYTGLKDKNGKEIYEGDILWVKPIMIGNSTGEIRWSEKSFRFLFDNGTNWGLNDILLTNKHTIEIIGNIYENPDLASK